MSYYGISVLVTILVTTLTAFYLLYKAKELNLGIMVAITAGSIVLGCSFNPAFKSIMSLLINTITLNRKVALVLSLIVVLLIFLLFIIILSFLISLIIPKKFASIDCGVYIDRFISGVKNSFVGLFEKVSRLVKKSGSALRNIVISTYNLKNKLKKPVDTNQIIDTMGIEKSEDAVIVSVSDGDIAAAFESIAATDELSLTTDAGDDAGNEVTAAAEASVTDVIGDAGADQSDTYKGLLDESSLSIDEVAAEEEVIDEVAAEIEVIDEVAEVLDESAGDEGVDFEATDTEGTSLFEPAESSTATDDTLIDIVNKEDTDILKMSEQDSEVLNDDTEYEEAALVNEADIPEEDDILISTPDEIQPELPDSDIDSIDDNNMDLYYSNNAFDNSNNADAYDMGESPAGASVMKAFEYKDMGRKDLAIECYLEAMEQGPDKEMIFWIVLDVCSLYKQMGLTELAKSILEGLVENYEAVIRPEIKEEIIKNLK